MDKKKKVPELDYGASAPPSGAAASSFATDPAAAALL